MRIDPSPISDDRGFFARIFCKEELGSQGVPFDLAQCNNTLTRRRGSIRGLHFQRPPKAERKIVRCVQGAIYDVAVDLRRDSGTYGQFCTCELSASNRSMLLIPPGFAHGFQTLTDDVELIYFHSEFYSPDHEGGVCPLDSVLGIPWPQSVAEISKRDQNLANFGQVEPIEL